MGGGNWHHLTEKPLPIRDTFSHYLPDQPEKPTVTPKRGVWAAPAEAVTGEDTARLHWLSQRCFRRPGPTTPYPVYCIVDSSHWAPRPMVPNERLNALREAIDAARQLQGEKK